MPVQTGFSYSDLGLPSAPMNAASAAVEVHAFLQLFFSRFPDLGVKPFHIAGESWGGQVIPHIASTIVQKNQEIALGKTLGKKINLTSILLGNGMTDALRQFPTLAEYICEGPYALLEPGSDECAALYQKSRTCERMIKACYDYKNALVCAPAETYCWGLLDPIIKAKKNHYDLRKPCSDAEQEHNCYTEMNDIQVFMNLPHVKAQLGVDPKIEFKECNLKLFMAYRLQGRLVWDMTRVVPELINGGIRVLAYSGNADGVCNYMGVEAFVGGMATVFADEFGGAMREKWIVGNRTAGYVRAAGGDGKTAGNQTFIAVYEAGHMAPYDQPEATLDMFNKWINNKPIVG